MGGAKAGKFASNMAASMFEQAIRTADPDRLAAKPGRLVASSIEQINRRMYEYSAGQREFAGMGTTCVAAILSGGGRRRQRGRQPRLSHRRPAVPPGHTRPLCGAGAGGDGRNRRGPGKKHPQRNVITRSLGPDDHTEIDLFEVDVRKKTPASLLGRPARLFQRRGAVCIYFHRPQRRGNLPAAGTGGLRPGRAGQYNHYFDPLRLSEGVEFKWIDTPAPF